MSKDEEDFLKRLPAFLCLSLCILLTACSRSATITEIASPSIQRDPFSRRPIIVIDAGHGGRDAGAQSLKEPQYQEKALTLSTAVLLNQCLQRLGYQTILTRGADTFVPLELRSAFANSNRAALFVSIHYNSAANVQAEGIEVYYYQSDTNKMRTENSKKLAQIVLDRVITSTRAKSRGIKHGNFSVIRETQMPAILIEGGFVSNKQELLKLLTPRYRQQIAESIAQGIQDYTRSGVTQGP